MEIVSDTELTEESDVECTGWTGGINHVLSDSDDDEDSDWEEIVIQIVMKILISKSWKAKIWQRA